jgi:16S rRNA G527 N7-methylase RsmG
LSVLYRECAHWYKQYGREGREEVVAAEKQLDDQGAKVVDCIHLKLPVSGAERFLVVVEKLTEQTAE